MKTILSYSGGLDSTVLLYHLKYQLGHEVRCLSVNYGQRHRREIEAAQHIAGLNNSEFQVADLSAVKNLFAGSSQTSDIPVPEGHYAEESMKQTVVPNRNMVLLSLATAWAVSTKSDFVAYAAHTGDHAIYPDCRPAFTEAMEDAIRLCDWHVVKLLRPFLYPTPMDKTEIVKMGKVLGVPFALTWSCYKGGIMHCGKCGTCVERKEAFKLADVVDPTIYG
jgi:7-cyano-7-deazaguanine synthase